MQEGYRKKLRKRAWRILWSPIEIAAAVVGLLIILSRPVMDYLLNWWEGLPWWVGLLLLVLLVSYALIRAGHELWKEEEQKRKEAQAGLLEQEPARHAALQEFFNQMERLLRDKEKPLRESSPLDDVRTLARRHTLAALERGGPNHKKSVLQFLQELRLLDNDQPIVRLDDGNLSGASLTRMRLIVNLNGVRLNGADLSNATLSALVGSSADMAKAAQSGMPNEVFEKPLAASSLEHADLSGAILKGARLAGCSLIGANLTGANLDDADLRGADLRLAKGLTKEQINWAYGGTCQLQPAQDTLLPDCLQAPTAWSNPIHEQIEARA